MTITDSDSRSDLKARFPEFNPERRFRMLIDGEWVEASSGETFRCVDPFDASEWGYIPEATVEDAERAVAGARRAFDEGGWPQTAPAYRARLLRNLGALIEAHADELARLQVHENGKTLREMTGGVHALAGDAYFFSSLAETVHGRTVTLSKPNTIGYTLREPIGVVAAITPWNTPLGLLAWKLFPAVAAGNAVVIKPSEVTPTSTLLLAELVMEAGFPPGVVNVVTGHGVPAGSTLVESSGVDRIAFTGATGTGKHMAKVAADRVARVSLELGGKSPNVVFADADLDRAVQGVLIGMFSAAGQACNAGSRVLVEASIHDEFEARLVAEARRIRLGDPLDPNVDMGPIANRAQLEKVLRYIEIGHQGGARLVIGGHRVTEPAPLEKGFFVEPTLFSAVDNSSQLAREEVFGPVSALMPFKDEQDAVRVANDSDFGLVAGLWTLDVNRAHRMIGKLRAGALWVNTYRTGSHALPFGGFKQSGVGREAGIEAVHDYTEEKAVVMDLGNPISFFG